MITNITTEPTEVGKLAALYAVVDSNGTAEAVVIGDNLYAISTVKTDAAIAAIKGCKGCTVLAFEDTPIADVANRMPQLATTLLARFGKKWTYTIAVNDLWFDFMAPSLQAAGIDPDGGYPRQISAGDGSVPAFQRIRAEALPDRHGRRTAAPARLDVHRRTEPRVRRRKAQRLRPAAASVHPRQHRPRRRCRTTSTTRRTATGTSTRKSGGRDRRLIEATIAVPIVIPAKAGTQAT